MSTTDNTIPTGIQTLSNSITEINSAGSYLIDKKLS